ncbi:MAG TPA: response regulator, partial [Bordetella sp.]|nr:response regulator [Bordetella sp.]
EIVQHVFEPFFSTKGQHENSGLGLSQVVGFVQQSGGDVGVSSIVGQGTTFTLYLPAASLPEAVDDAPATTRSSADLGARKSILLVEDNRLVGEVVSNLLQDLGQQPTWVLDAPAALQILAEKNRQFDIAILDVNLPGMNGVELAKQIRAGWPAIRIVLASGYSEAIAGQDAVEFPLMQKPYSVEMLSKVLAA